jgi:Family of unknown function (DUF6169)
MTNETLPSYTFSYLGGINNVYSFSTHNAIDYEVAFKPTPYGLGDESPYADDIFELVLKIIDSPEGENIRPPFDALTAPTVAAIIKDFYDRSDLYITIYICDTSDRRQKARWYKFNRWYDYFNANNYYRADRAVLDEKDGVLYHCAIILKAANPRRFEIFAAFDRMLEGYNNTK